MWLTAEFLSRGCRSRCNFDDQGDQVNDFSIDTETLGVRPDAAILSIGVVQFDRDTGKLGKKFYVEIDIDSAIASGSISGSTLAWWIEQSPRAKQLFAKDRQEQKVSLATALHQLRTFFLDAPAGKAGPDQYVWGNGATADITWLENAYLKGSVGLEVPWKFWNIRDMRTAVDMSGVDPKNWPFPNNAVAHNALDDAARQAQIIAAAFRKIRGAEKEAKEVIVKAVQDTAPAFDPDEL